MLEKDKTSKKKDKKYVASYDGGILRDLYSLSGKEALNQILDMNRPEKLIRKMPAQDFFWLVKKVGDNDCLPLLEMASEEQWQYLLDMEVWQKDRVNLDQTFSWLARLQISDPQRLVKWLFSQGQELIYLFLFNNIHVEIRREEEAFDLKKEFFTLDGTFYIKVTQKEYREVIEGILRTMIMEDHLRYQAILSGLVGVYPAEMEENMYRTKNIRLAEHGFLPFEEALSVYAPLDPDSVSIEKPRELPDFLLDEETLAMVPFSPLYHNETGNMLAEVLSGITDPMLAEKIRLEFAGLSNQILSADGVVPNDLDVLVKTCRRAGAYLNLALEELCGADIALAEKVLRKNPLLSVFRIGFGLLLKLKWEAERWLEESWFYKKGLEFTFWGDEWGETLAGLTAKRPRLYTDLQEGEEYRDFRSLSDLDSCRKCLHSLMVLDRLLRRLEERYPLDEKEFQEPGRTFYPLLFNLWARRLMELEPCFSGIGHNLVKAFFALLRVGERKPPFRMSGYKATFVGNFLDYASDFEPEVKETLGDTLALIWEEFREEYAWITLDHLDGRFSRFIQITSGSPEP